MLVRSGRSSEDGWGLESFLSKRDFLVGKLGIKGLVKNVHEKREGFNKSRIILENLVIYFYLF